MKDKEFETSMTTKETEDWVGWVKKHFLHSPVNFSAEKFGSPPGGETAYPLLHRSVNRQVANMVTKNDTNGSMTNISLHFH
ncbi:hypothetical protein TNCV_4530001 [Trichonephila clavipes]|nr:hypothetical protein TNCV_4530001 [Trichonephila clavipes]